MPNLGCINYDRLLSQYLSSYIELVGHTQTVGSGEDFVFNISEEYADNVGNNFTVGDNGREIIINQPGLYHIEWSLNLNTEGDEFLVGLLENGQPASAITSSHNLGSHSSGALIQVLPSEVPYSIRLHNFGIPIDISSYANTENTAISIRILKFASGATK